MSGRFPGQRPPGFERPTSMSRKQSAMPPRTNGAVTTMEAPAPRLALRVSLTAVALLAALPFLAWAAHPTTHLLPGTRGGETPGEMLAVVARNPALPGDGLYIAALALMALCALLAVALALTILWRGTPGSASLHLVGFLLGGAAVVGLAYFAIPLGVPEWYARTLITMGRMAEGTAALSGGVWLASLLKFSLLFPRPLHHQELQKHTRLRNRGDAWLFRNCIAFIQSPWSWAFFLGGPTLAALLAPGAGYVLVHQMALFALIGAYLFLKLARRAASETDRRRIDVIFLGFSTALWSFLLVAILPFALGPLLGDVGYGLYVTLLLGFSATIAGLCLILGLAAAVLVGGALDPAIALQRTTLFGTLGVLWVGAYGAIENLLSEWIEARMPLTGTAAALILGAALAMVMIPIHGWLKPMLERAQNTEQPPS